VWRFESSSGHQYITWLAQAGHSFFCAQKSEACFAPGLEGHPMHPQGVRRGCKAAKAATTTQQRMPGSRLCDRASSGHQHNDMARTSEPFPFSCPEQANHLFRAPAINSTQISSANKELHFCVVHYVYQHIPILFRRSNKAATSKRRRQC
jgi:hypothetical protein